MPRFENRASTSRRPASDTAWLAKLATTLIDASTAAAPTANPIRVLAAASAVMEALLAGGAVNAFTEEIGVAVVAGVLLDHVDVDPAKGDVVVEALPATDGVEAVDGGRVLPRPLALGAPGN